MATVYHNIKSYFSNEEISRIAAYLGDNNDQVSSAVNLTLHALQKGVVLQGKSNELKNIFQDANKVDLLDTKTGILSNDGKAKLAIGERFANYALGKDEKKVASLISSYQLMSNDNSKKLLAIVSAVFAGFLGRRLTAVNGDMDKVLNELATDGNEKNSAAMPVDKKKSSKTWLWILLVLLLLLLCFWAFRRCGSCNRMADTETVEVVVPATPVVESNTYELDLATGDKLVITKGSMEDKLVTFLRSDNYKNATEEELASQWFEFEGIDFEYNSPNQLMEGSPERVNNLAFILKYFSDAKVRIGGNADHKGTDRVNMEISKVRAATIKNLFVQAGVEEARISTEGFGEEKAMIPATATDAQRAPDRDIALRFTK